MFVSAVQLKVLEVITRKQLAFSSVEKVSNLAVLQLRLRLVPACTGPTDMMAGLNGQSMNNQQGPHDLLYIQCRRKMRKKVGPETSISKN